MNRSRKNFSPRGHAVVAGLVTGIPKPIVKDGYIDVPTGVGPGAELNDEVVKAHLRRSGYFEPTPMFEISSSPASSPAGRGRTTMKTANGAIA